MIGLGVAVVAAVVTWFLDRRRRRYADRATTPAAALFAGFNLVSGRGWVEHPIHSYRTRTPSLWWEYVLEEERRHTRTVTDSQGRTRTETTTSWHTVETRSDNVPEIEVVDDTGSALVRLEGASVVPTQVHSATFRRDDMGGILGRLLSAGNGATGRYRETEKVVRFGADLFVAGECELDEERLVPVIARKVMVSTRKQASHVRWLTVGVLFFALVTMVALTVGVATLIRPDQPSEPVAWVPGLGAALLLFLAAWVVSTYNRLQMVAQAANRAWSLIDVQLRRRHDLIPALQRVVAAHADHERATHTALAEVRAGSVGQAGAAGEAEAAGEAGAAGEDEAAGEAEALSDEAEVQTRALRTLLAVAEDYPELRSDASFARLQGELADTEDRIAASRTFYNDSLTILRDRQQRFPGSLVARRVSVEHRDHIEARGFERTVPAVRHSFDTPPSPAEQTSSGG